LVFLGSFDYVVVCHITPSLPLDWVELPMIALDFAPTVARMSKLLILGFFSCPTLSSHRCDSLNFINDLFSRFSRRLNEFNSTASSRPTIDSKKYINHFILMFLLGGTLALNVLHIDSGELRDNYMIILLKVSRSLLFRILWALRNFSLKLYLSLVARLNYYLISIVKYQSQPGASTSYR